MPLDDIGAGESSRSLLPFWSIRQVEVAAVVGLRSPYFWIDGAVAAVEHQDAFGSSGAEIGFCAIWGTHSVFS